MTVSNTALRITELDFDSIKTNLKNYLRSQTEFQDFDFEGSGMSVLLDILAYNTHYMGYHLNVIANEMFLDTAQIRSSILSHAKLLGYMPKSSEGAKAILNITVTPSTTENGNTNQLTLNKYTRFIGEDIDGNNYNFVTLYSNTASKISGSFAFANVAIKQGEIATYQYLMNSLNESRSFVIPTANMDTSTLTVTVQESSSNTDTSEYIICDDITSVTSNSKIFFLNENFDLTYTVQFGDNVIGKRPDNGNIITCTFLNTIGSSGNNISNFVLAENIGQFRDNVTISVSNSSFGGSDKETVEQTRFRAPYAFTAQNRAVTTKDYETLLLRKYPSLDAVAVWGGEDNDPPTYGKVYLSLKTKGDYYLTNVEKENIKNELISTHNILTVIPEIIDPDYSYIMIKGQVTYNPGLTSKTSSELIEYVKNSIYDYIETELNSYSSTFRTSKLQRYIESSEKSITGSDISIYVQKRLEITPNVSKRYMVESNIPIDRGRQNRFLSTYPAIKIIDGGGIERKVFFEEIPSDATGIASIDIINAGKNYSYAPTVTITGDGTGATAVAKVIGGRLSSITVTNKGKNYTRASVELTGGGGVSGECVTKLERYVGNFRTYYIKDITGEKVIINTDAGDIDYETGKFDFHSVYTSGTVENDLYDDNILTVNFPISKQIISPSRNRIITVDQNDPLSIQIEMVSEN